MESKRLEQEIERHRHITPATKCYPSEMKARMGNAALDFSLNNELNHIAKQMKHFKVSYERAHIRAFKRRKPSLTVESSVSALSPATRNCLPQDSQSRKMSSSSIKQQGDSNKNIESNQIKKTIRGKSSNTPTLPNLNNNNDMVHSSAISDDKAILRSIIRKANDFDFSLKEVNYPEGSGKQINRQRLLRRSSLFGTSSFDTSTGNTMEIFKSHLQRQRQCRSISVDFGSLPSKSSTKGLQRRRSSDFSLLRNQSSDVDKTAVPQDILDTLQEVVLNEKS